MEGNPEGKSIGMAGDIPKGMTLLRVKNPVTGQFEESMIPLNADMVCGDPSLKQEQDDAELLKNTGDSYARIQKGAIYAGDGETRIECDLTFIRTRNARGGVDVKCIIPCLATLPEMTMGKP